MMLRKLFAFFRSTDEGPSCGVVVATSRDEAVKALTAELPLHDVDDVDYVYEETDREPGVYPMSQSEYLDF